MDAFMNWFFAFMTTIFEGFWNAITGLFGAVFQFFNFPVLFDQLSRYKTGFNVLGWVLCILTVILAYGIFAAVIFLIVICLTPYKI